METIVVSDVHIGSKYFLRDRFLQFLRGLPPEATLVLNGDVMDAVHRPVSAPDRPALNRLREESFRRRVVWVYGNHDEGFRLDDPGRIEFQPSFSIGKRLFAAHGYDFDNVMPRHRVFVALFRILHRTRLALGAEAVHVAQYAKKWKVLYKILIENVLENALEFAQENGYEAVACGHTHFAQDTTMEGIRYFNTGAWTERPVFCLQVLDDGMELVEVTDA